jgi:DNA-binding NtrC family response regulator
VASLLREWPGNVRELANMIERAVALTDHDTILLENILLTSPPLGKEDLLSGALSNAAARKLSLAEVERAYIHQVLETAHGNKAYAARILGIDRKTLYHKLDASNAPEDSVG